MSLRARLALLSAIVAVGGVVAASAFGYVSTRRELQSEVDAFLERRTSEIVEGSRDVRGRRGQPPEVDIAVEDDAIVQVLDADGTPIGSTGPALPVDATEARIARSGAAPVTRDVTVDGEPYRMRTMALRREGLGAVQVARSLVESRDVLAGVRSRLLVVGAVVAVVAAVAGWLVARRTTAPLRRLATTAGHVAETGELRTRVATDRRDEVGQLSRSFDDMLSALATSREQQHRLVQDAAHELRTPLTALRTDLGMLRRVHDTDEDQRAEVVASLEAEVVDLSDLVGELIALATGSHDDDPVEALDLAVVAAAAVDSFQRRSGRAVDLEASPSPVEGRRTLLERAISNLLGNAHKFSPPDLAVTVVVEDGAVLVRDHGPGIPADERDRVFDRFYRGESAHAVPGSGLGLAIVEQVVRRHHGTVHVGDAPGGGAEVGFRLPTAPASS